MSKPTTKLKVQELLQNEPGILQVEIAKRLGLTKQRVSNIVTQLRKEGAQQGQEKDLSTGDIGLYVTIGTLATVLMLSTREVTNLVKQFVIKREADGKFHLPNAVKDYYIFKLKPRASAGVDSVVANYDDERALHERAKREKAEIELEQLKGKLLLAADVEQAMATMILICKARLLAIPSKCAPRVLGQKNLAVIQDLIKTEIHQALEELKEMPAPRDEVGDADAADTGIY